MWCPTHVQGYSPKNLFRNLSLAGMRLRIRNVNGRVYMSLECLLDVLIQNYIYTQHLCPSPIPSSEWCLFAAKLVAIRCSIDRQSIVLHIASCQIHRLFSMGMLVLCIIDLNNIGFMDRRMLLFVKRENEVL